MTIPLRISYPVRYSSNSSGASQGNALAPARSPEPIRRTSNSGVVERSVETSSVPLQMGGSGGWNRIWSVNCFPAFGGKEREGGVKTIW